MKDFGFLEFENSCYCQTRHKTIKRTSMLWPIVKGFIVGFFVTWFLWAAVTFIAVFQFDYNGPTNGATVWCLFFGFLGAWRGRIKYKKKFNVVN